MSKEHYKITRFDPDRSLIDQLIEEQELVLERLRIVGSFDEYWDELPPKVLHEDNITRTVWFQSLTRLDLRGRISPKDWTMIFGTPNYSRDLIETEIHRLHFRYQELDRTIALGRKHNDSLPIRELHKADTEFMNFITDFEMIMANAATNREPGILNGVKYWWRVYYAV